MISNLHLSVGILRLKIVRAIFTRLGINVRQYQVLLRLFAALNERLEFMGSALPLNKVAGGFAALSFLLSLVVLAGPALHKYLLGMLGICMFFLIWILLEDTTNSLLNPEEASVLAHQPIGGATYVAAKLSHLLSLLALFVPALAGIPALAGLLLKGSRWFYPLTHLLAAYCAGLFVAFLICGIYGWLFRFVAPARLKNVALWLQLLVFISPYVLQRAAMMFEIQSGKIFARIAGSSWFPLQWFAALGLAGHSSNPGFSAVQAWIGILVTLALIGFGLRTFREDYLIKASLLIQGGASPARRSSDRSRLSALVRRLTGAPSGHGAFAFTCTMLRRDWNFRRQGLLNMAMFLTTLPVVVVAGIKTSPFTLYTGAHRTFSAMHFLPHCLGLIAMTPCSLLVYTAEPRGSWIFTILPMGELKPFARGIYLSLWIPIVGIIHLCLLGPCIWFWGVTQGMIFIAYSTTVASFYLSLASFLIDGLPFVEAFAPYKAQSLQLGAVVGLLCALVLGGLQWVLFHNMWLVVGATGIFALMGFFVGRAGLVRLEKEMGANVLRLAVGPQKIFRDVETSIWGRDE